MSGLPTVWLTARAAGVTAYVLMTLSMLAGLTLTTRPLGRRVSGSTVMEIHRSLTIGGLVAVGVHGIALVADRTVDISWLDLVVPGMLPYRPVWTAAGIIAGELMLILAVSFRLRRRIGMHAWRTLHRAAFAMFSLATLHGVLAGTDSSSPWMRWVYVTAIATVAGGVAFRILLTTGASSVRSPDRKERTHPRGIRGR